MTACMQTRLDTALAEIERLNNRLDSLRAQCESAELLASKLQSEVERLTVTWTDAKPTEPGDWWYRLTPHHQPERVRLSLGLSGVLRGYIYGEWKSCDAVTGQWSNKPIHEPKEPTNGTA